MFSGIVETRALVLAAVPRDSVLQLTVERPKTFDDLRVGDSIAVNGVCLTLEAFDKEGLQFALAPETLRVTGWSPQSVLQKDVNLERSLRLSDRIHGHLVTGHVDGLAKLIRLVRQGDTQEMWFEIPLWLRVLIWPKGSVAVNGVSLTINQVRDGGFSVGLIPETLRRTNLGDLILGDTVNLEADNMARGIVHWAQMTKQDASREPLS